MWLSHLYICRNLQSISASLQVIRLSRIPGWVCTSSCARWGEILKEQEGRSEWKWENEGGRDGKQSGWDCCMLASYIFIAEWSPLCDVGRGDLGIVWGWCWNSTSFLSFRKHPGGFTIMLTTNHHLQPFWQLLLHTFIGGILALSIQQPFKWPFVVLLWFIVV